jgi:hypothetical protein
MKVTWRKCTEVIGQYFNDLKYLAVSIIRYYVLLRRNKTFIMYLYYLVIVFILSGKIAWWRNGIRFPTGTPRPGLPWRREFRTLHRPFTIMYNQAYKFSGGLPPHFLHIFFYEFYCNIFPLTFIFLFNYFHWKIINLNFLFYIIINLSRMRLSQSTTGPFYHHQITRIDNGDCGVIGGMKIGKGQRSTRRKLAPVQLCPP